MKHVLLILLLAASTIAYNPGDYTVTLMHDGLEREYQVHVPQNVQDPAPLVFVFHPWLGTATNMRRISSFDDKADEEQFIAVFPQGIGNSWNAGGCCGTAQQDNVDDIGFVVKMLDEIGQNHNIDTTRVYATGFSNGGMLSHRIGAELSDRFAAVAAVAGARVTFNGGPSRPISVLHINAVDDPRSTMTLTNRAVNWWINADSCSASTTQELNQGAYCDVYPCADGAELRLCVTQDGGHSWPMGWSLQYTPSTAFDATDMIWDFFTQNSLEGCMSFSGVSTAVSNWKDGSISIEELLQTINEWKSGC